VFAPPRACLRKRLEDRNGRDPRSTTLAHVAIQEAFEWAEGSLFATRVGKAGAQHVPVRGVIAAAFDHWDSRANDPQLHTHVVVANRAQTHEDSKWRTLDSRAIFRATVALSELHQGLLMDRITELLGTGWDGRPRRHSPVVQWEVAGVSDELRTEFSQRSGAIEQTKDALVTAYRDAHGRTPSLDTVIKLRQQATLSTRPDKQLIPLADLVSQWRARAASYVGTDGAAWARQLPRADVHRRQSADLTADDIQALAEQTLAAVADRRATFARWNVFAEAHRQLQAARLLTARDRVEISNRITDSALGMAVLLTAGTDMEVDTDHGRSSSTARFTTRAIYEAEDRLLDAGRNLTAPTAIVDGASSGLGLSDEQRNAIQQIVESGRTLDVLLGAAGTGKTATMAGLAAVWHSHYGSDSMIGLAPSAVAAEVLARELNLPTENTAKWIAELDRQSVRRSRLGELHELTTRLPTGSPPRRRIDAAIGRLAAELDRWSIKPGQLLLVDEASLAGTLTLDRIVTEARQSGAKVLLVGDTAQLSSIEAGGALAMLVPDRGDVPELAENWRFTHDWERHASVALRGGNPAALDAYQAHGRIHEASRDQALTAAYTAWLREWSAGVNSLLIAADAATVAELNTRARADLIAAGLVAADGVGLTDGTTAGVGDRIVTRRNDRTIEVLGSWLKNGDEWTVDRVDDTGMIVYGGGSAQRITLPIAYVSEHVELAYATTAHRAQGRTVDTAHAIVSGPRMTREALYVSATRARQENHVYVAVNDAHDVESDNNGVEHPTARAVLTAVMANSGIEQSAHATGSLARPGSRPNQLARDLDGIDSLKTAVAITRDV
jgi:conjugative relaxase-like TrwC/TraI family protein